MTNHKGDGDGSDNYVDEIQTARMMMKQSNTSNNNIREHNEGMKHDALVPPRGAW